MTDVLSASVKEELNKRIPLGEWESRATASLQQSSF